MRYRVRGEPMSVGGDAPHPDVPTGGGVLLVEPHITAGAHPSTTDIAGLPVPGHDERRVTDELLEPVGLVTGHLGDGVQTTRRHRLRSGKRHCSRHPIQKGQLLASSEVLSSC